MLLGFLDAAASFTIGDLLNTISTIFSAFIGMVDPVVDTVTENPLLLFCIAASFAGVGISIFVRLVRAAKGV